VHHSTTIRQLGEGAVQAVCSCGWRSPVFGADKTAGTMDPLQHATEAADLHEWEMSLRLAMLRAWPDVAATPGKPIWHPGSTHREAEGCHPQVGWQRPCYPMNGCAETYRELSEASDWAKYGRGRDPRCASGMPHCGDEPTAVLATMGSLGQSLRALAAA